MFHTNCILEIRGLNESVSVLAGQHRNAYLLVHTYQFIWKQFLSTSSSKGFYVTVLRFGGCLFAFITLPTWVSESGTRHRSCP